MSVYIEWLNHEDESYNPLIEASIKAVLSFEQITTATEVAVTIVDNTAIRAINLEQRQIDRATDVLSFPMIDYLDGSSKEEQVASEPCNPENNEVYLGDVVLSWDKVVEQSEAYGHSLKRELSFLVVHSILHLLGYDHMIEADEVVMVQKQKDIMTIMGLER